MKKTAFVVVMLLCGIVAANAQIKFAVGPEAGIAIVSVPEPMNQYYGFGYGFGAHADMEIMKYFGIALNLDYRMFPLDKTKFGNYLAGLGGVAPGSVTVSGLTVSTFSVMLNGVGKIPLDGPVTPYGVVGLGLGSLSMSDPTITFNGQDITALVGLTKAPSETDFALNFGAGAEFKVAKTVGLFLDFRYFMVFTKDKNTTFFPITVGASFYI